MRCRSGHGKALAVAGAYLRVSGPLGPLTGVYADATATFLSAMNLLVTTSIIKSDVVPALWAGAASLISGGDGCEVSDM